MLRSTSLVVLVASIMLGACDEKTCENGYKIKTEYKTIFGYEQWHESLKDTLLDGAIRTTTWSLKNARGLTIRCFKASPVNARPEYDLRYSINVPLLSKLGADLEKVGGAELVVTVDGTAVGTFKTRVIANTDGLAFLSALTPEMVDKLASASKTIVVMPRQKGTHLDEMIEFGVARLAEHIKPVKAACDANQFKQPEEPAEPQQATKKT